MYPGFSFDRRSRIEKPVFAYSSIATEGTDFYYLGKMNYNSFEDTTMKSGESVVNIRFDMETPIPQNLYNYLEGA